MIYICKADDFTRKIGASKEQARREREKEDRDNDYEEAADEDEMDV